MKIIIKATNTSLTPAITDYVNKKIGTLDRFVDKNDESVRADVEVGMISRHHHSGDIFRTEINLWLKGGGLRATAEAGDLYSSIDQAKDQLAEELRSHNKKKDSLMRRGGQAIKSLLRGFKK